MDQVLALLLQARDVAHIHHWKVKSFAQHMALGELYDLILVFTDELAEMAMGAGHRVGDVQLDQPTGWDKGSANGFITQLHQELEKMKSMIPQEDWYISKYEELQMAVAKVKYKLENLS